MTVAKRPRLIDSIFARVLLFVTVTLFLMVSVQIVLSTRSTTRVLENSVLSLGSEITNMVSSAAAAAIKFGKFEDVESELNALIEETGGKVSGALAINQDGQTIAMALSATSNEAALSALAQAAIETNQTIVDAETKRVAVPAYVGQSGDPVGAIVVAWSLESTLATVFEDKIWLAAYFAIFIGMFVMAVGWSLRKTIAVPMRNLSATLSAIAQGDYDADLSKVSGKNEIGLLATNVENLQSKLRQARLESQEGLFKGAAFENSSAAMMIANENFEITSLNEAYSDLVKTHADEMKASLPRFEPENLIGANLDIFHKAPDAIRAMLKGLTSSHISDLEFGNILIRLVISPISGSDGERIGYVVEWMNATEDRKNAAILETFENSQAVIEFDEDHKLVSANHVVESMCGANAATLLGKSISEFVSDSEGKPVEGLKEASFGDYELWTANDEPAHFLGTLTPIRNGKGKIKRTVLLGADVSIARGKALAADAERARMQDEQDTMIEALRSGLAALSEGDLTVNLTGKFANQHDQLRVDFNQAITNVSDTVGTVLQKSSGIHQDVSDISSAAGDLSKRTEHQAGTLETTAAALAEITTSVSSAADGAKRAAEVVKEARTNAEKSGGVVQDAVSAMGEISESSSQISNIISVIDDIAFQTNLLALNAGVEAARAGDAGRGFAVVASEVRALAQRSSDAAREINALISASGEHVERGVNLVGNAGEALKSIVTSVGDISSHVEGIAASAQEQSTGLSEINSAINQLDQVTQQNVAMFEETSAASTALSKAANELTQAAAHFKVAKSNPPANASTPPIKPSVPQASTGTHGQATDLSEVELDDDWTDF
jgi:methyl-accepting chemotaxis protein